MKIGIYFDATGYGITGYTLKKECFYIEYLEKSIKPSLKTLSLRLSELRAEEIYCNDSRLLLGILYGLKVPIKRQHIKQNRETDLDFIYSDCFETVSALLADNQIVVSQKFERQFTESFRDYDSEEISHVVLSVFHSISIQRLYSARARKSIYADIFIERNSSDFRGHLF